MDAQKTGQMIRLLRKEKGLTQLQLAQILHVSDKAVSKWERAQGCPDVSLLPALSEVLGVSAEQLLAGFMKKSKCDGGNMKRLQFFVCPSCGNVISQTGAAQICCCGRKLEPLSPSVCDEAHRPVVEQMDGELYLHFDHPMTKAHFIRFVAFAGYDRVLIVRLYPEQEAALRMPYMPRAAVYIGCSEEGLYQCRL